MSRSISSVEGLIRKISKLDKGKSSNERIFYRGHSDRKSFKLSPSLYRDTGWKKNEHILVNEILSANPADFRDDRSMFEKLVRMQHHSLPTRLLDITSNPLMALYFASCELEDKPGEVVIFRIKESEIKYSDSDTVSCIANLARLTDADHSSIDTNDDQNNFNKSDSIIRLHHFIKEEKPYFNNCIIPLDLKKILCVRPRMSNVRIASQSGAFLLFGLDAIFPEDGLHEIKVIRVPINKNKKKKICGELESLNIHRGTVYPNVDSSSAVIKNKYREKDLKMPDS